MLRVYLVRACAYRCCCSRFIVVFRRNSSLEMELESNGLMNFRGFVLVGIWSKMIKIMVASGAAIGVVILVDCDRNLVDCGRNLIGNRLGFSRTLPPAQLRSKFD